MSAPVAVTSCLVCLQADEIPSMVAFKIEHDPVNPAGLRLICRRCTAAIVEAWRQLDETLATVTTEPNEGEDDR